MANEYTDSYKKLIERIPCDEGMKEKFIQRIEEGVLTRDENPLTHLCIYFAAYDPKNKQVFIGHHKKANLWLFNGGHIDEGELPIDALIREASEEWGGDTNLNSYYEPSFLTITEIDNLPIQKCQRHYDIWFFVPLDKEKFKPDLNLLAKEFHETGWKSIDMARKLVTQPQTLGALKEIEKLFI